MFQRYFLCISILILTLLTLVSSPCIHVYPNAFTFPGYLKQLSKSFAVKKKGWH